MYVRHLYLNFTEMGLYLSTREFFIIIIIWYDFTNRSLIHVGPRNGRY